MQEQDQTDLQTIELSMEEIKKVVRFGDHLTSLERNRAFQSVILEGYFVEEASRLTMLLADQNLDANGKADVFDSLKAISHLRRFLMTRRQFARMAEKELADFQQAAEEIRGEG